MNSCPAEGVRDPYRGGMVTDLARNRQLRLQLDSGREHPPRD
eukprot:gene27007-biopygen17577